MPAALQIDKEQVRIVAVTVGVREAARQFGLPEGTVRAWSCREGWLVEKEQVQSVQERAVAVVREKQGLQPHAANAADSRKAFDGETRLGHAHAASKVAGKLKVMDADELFLSAPLLAQHAKHAATVFGWSGGDNNVSIRLDVIAAQSGSV